MAAPCWAGSATLLIRRWIDATTTSIPCVASCRRRAWVCSITHLMPTRRRTWRRPWLRSADRRGKRRPARESVGGRACALRAHVRRRLVQPRRLRRQDHRVCLDLLLQYLDRLVQLWIPAGQLFGHVFLHLDVRFDTVAF